MGCEVANVDEDGHIRS